LFGAKKDDVQEANHNTEGAKDGFLWSKGSDKSTVDQGTED
jgi:hypothetical protein